MERSALLLVDSGLLVVGSRGNVSQPSPGLALIDGDGLMVGADAVLRSRLKPRRIHSRFWQLLGTEPLRRPHPHHLRTADLAHAHLCEVWRTTGDGSGEVILVVPGSFSGEQLGLLLGIAEAAEIPVRGLVDLGVAAAADRAVRRRCFHLDLHLHRAVLTEIEHGPDLVRGRVWDNEGIGLARLWDIWARTVARLFVRQTRFDPLQPADTEQRLYVDLPRHLEALIESETVRIGIASGGHLHEIDVLRRDLVEASREAIELISGWVEELADLEDATLLVSNHIALVPGLVDRFRAPALREVAVLHPAAAGSAALRHAGHIVTGAEALPFVTRLPGYDARPPGPVTVPVTPPAGTRSGPSGPTHFVVDGVAQPISEEPVVIPIGTTSGAETADPEHPGLVTIRRVGAVVVVDAPPGLELLVNGQKAESSAVLLTGDRLHLGEPAREVILVTMVP